MELVYGETVCIYDTKTKNGIPNIGVRVSIFDVTRNRTIGQSVTDKYGKYYFEFQKPQMPSGLYELRYYGGGYRHALKPVGDWENFEIINPDSIISMRLNSNNGIVFKEMLDLSTYPANTVISCITQNISDTVYTWKKDGVVQVGTTSSLSVPESDVAAMLTVSCTVHGKSNNVDITPMTDVMTLVRLQDGGSGYSIILSNEADEIATDPLGENPNPSYLTTTVQLYHGIDTVPVILTENDLSTSNCTAVLLGENTVKILNFAADAGYVDITVNHSGSTIGMKRFSFARTRQGMAGLSGPAIAYRGTYDPAKTYLNASDLRDVVRYRANSGESWKYYLCNTNSLAGAFDIRFWKEMDSFDNVATNLLLADDTLINRSLVLGTEDSYSGVIRSATASALLTGNGFFLSEYSVGSSALLRIGTVSGGVLAKGILWTGSALQIKSDYCEFTQDGKFWASQGGFGGTSSVPKVAIDANGLVVKESTLSRLILTDTSALWSDQSSMAVIKTTLALHDSDCESGGAITDFWNVVYTANYTMDGVPQNTIPVITPNATALKETGDHHSGTKSIRLFPTCFGGSADTMKIVITQHSSISIGSDTKFVNVTFWYRQNANRENGSATCRVIDPSNSNILQQWNLGKVAATSDFLMTDWAQFSATFETSVSDIKLEFEVCNDFALHQQANDSVELILDDIYVGVYEPFVLLSKQGLLAFHSPATYLKVGPSVFEFKGMNIEVDSIIVKKNLTIQGQTYITGTEINGTSADMFRIGTGITSGNTSVRFGDYVNTGDIVYDGTAFHFTRNITGTFNIDLAGSINATSVMINGHAIGGFNPVVLVTSVPIVQGVSVAIPGSQSYVMGGNKLLVFVNGMLQIKDADNGYIEYSTTTVRFNFDIDSGASILFLIIGW